MFEQFIAAYGMEILFTIVTAIGGYIGIAIKTIYKNYVNDKIKKRVVKTGVRAVKQIYKDCSGEEKLSKAIGYISEMLCDKGINITDLEIRMLIEEAVEEMNESSGFLLCGETLETTEEMDGE